jgi:hypothetical protein
VHDDGRVSCWNSDLVPREVPGVERAKSATWDEFVFCVVFSDGTAGCSGRPGEALVPVKRLSDAVHVEAWISRMACFLLLDRTLQCVRPRVPDFGRLYHEEEHRLIGKLIPQPVDGVLEMATNHSAVGCVRVEGGVRCLPRMEREAHLQPVETVHLADSIQLAVGNDVACALTASGAVRCWQPERKKEFRADDLTSIDLPATAVAISSSCAVLEDRSLWCWEEGWLPEGRDRWKPHRLPDPPSR